MNTVTTTEETAQRDRNQIDDKGTEMTATRMTTTPAAPAATATTTSADPTTDTPRASDRGRSAGARRIIVI